MDFLVSLDRALFYFFNNLANLSPLFDVLFVFLAEVVIFLIILATLAFLFLKLHREKAKFVVMEAFAAAVFGRLLLTPFIRYFLFRERPFVSNDVNLLISHNPLESSFPSGHTVFMFAISFSVLRYHKRTGTIFLILSFISALSRVIVGVHYPADILGGILIGYIAFLISHWIFEAVRVR